MCFNTTHYVWDATSAGNNYFHNKCLMVKRILFLTLQENRQRLMRKTLSNIKETLQYTGIICLSLLSALWLFVQKRKTK